MTIEQVERFKRRAAQERERASRMVHPSQKTAALELADQYDAVAGAYARLLMLGGSIASDS